MEKKTKLLMTFSILIIMVAGLYVATDWFSKVTGFFTEDETQKLASCLNERGTEFYTSNYCADCNQQLKVFGSSINQVRTRDCGKEMENCPNIRSIPAWYINGEINYGVKTIDELREISDCLIE